MTRILTAIIVFSFVLSNSTSDLRAAECEDTIARHMVGEALLQPQASSFWPLIDGSKEIVIQGARKREIDNEIFKYVGVGGVDKARIIQVGVAAGNLCK